MKTRPTTTLLTVICFLTPWGAGAQTSNSLGKAQSPSGKTLYEVACARCHGHDGRGDRPDIEMDVRMPNFARCAESAEERDSLWRTIIENGGVALGLSPKMPAYGDVLNSGQVDSLIAYMREFCGDPRWVRGELNFPRPLFTEKAYPENELIMGPELRRERDQRTSLLWTTKIEKRIGPRSQVELSLPIEGSFAARENATGPGAFGVGNIELGFKQVLYDSLKNRFLLSCGLDLELPSARTGNSGGTVKFEPFVAFGKETRGWIVQTFAGVELPADTQEAERELVYRIAIGYPLWNIGGTRELFPTLEILCSRELPAREPTRVFIVPQLRVPIDRMGRWAFAIGPTLPASRRSGSRAGFAAYLLWEYLGR